MSRYDQTNAFRTPFRGRGRRWLTAVLPWLFVACVVAVTVTPVRDWVRRSLTGTADSPAARDAELVWRQSAGAGIRRHVDVLRTIDGDTFEARVHLGEGLEPVTRIRLRGIDAPELKASCPEELQMAEAATAALRKMLGEGEVTISNIGPDKYSGRVVAEVATRRTANVSGALLAAGYVRSYGGGHRSGWCANAGSLPAK